MNAVCVDMKHKPGLAFDVIYSTCMVLDPGLVLNALLVCKQDVEEGVFSSP